MLNSFTPPRVCAAAFIAVCLSAAAAVPALAQTAPAGPAPTATPAPASPRPTPLSVRGYLRLYDFTRLNAIKGVSAVNQQSIEPAVSLHADYRFLAATMPRNAILSP